MEERFRKFEASKQAAVKLSIAAEDFFREDLPENWEKAYGAYLQQRIRPAAELLIREEDIEKLQTLCELQWFPDQQLDDFLQLACREHKLCAYVWLLKRKREKLGFSPRDFSL